MKKIAFVFITITLFLFFIIGCDLIPVSIDARINMFIGDLNTNGREDIYKNFHPSTADREAMKDPAFFNESPLATDWISFSFVESGSTDLGGQQQVDGTFYNDSGLNDFTCYFIMEQDGESWFIREFHMDTFDITK